MAPIHRRREPYPGCTAGIAGQPAGLSESRRDWRISGVFVGLSAQVARCRVAVGGLVGIIIPAAECITEYQPCAAPSDLSTRHQEDQ